MTTPEASVKIDAAITQAIGALRALRREGDDIHVVIQGLAEAKTLARQMSVAVVASEQEAGT